ncbi:hypothetical protein [Nonomuraea jabiensis]|uniref:ABC-type branched-chain amino acid transport system, substrate-binding protein n=1 Tax=Nonomuraea jabiensis TaxID=882448 RepID=A0A7W9G4F3_9ACTN|nr:hypothetical protein [Nonomuraea jabiensis]MBB5776964.1 hypothetical protein [Nonomuraea jabiensis]
MSSISDAGLQIEPAPAYVRRRRRRWTALGALVAVLVATGLTFALRAPSRLTDASDAFDPSLADIMERIHAENDNVIAKHPGEYVTILLLLPMSGDVTETGMGFDTIRHALQGSHLAQLWRNREQSAAPYIRLLVGNISSDAWEDTVTDLEGRVRSERILAVTGLGNSVEATRRVIDRLSKSKIAMVAAVITSDELQRHEALVRMAPLNSDEAAALVRFAGQAVPALKPVVVMDTKPGDSYSRTLGEAYDKTLARVVDAKRRGRPLTFDSTVNASSTVIGNIADTICGSDANAVFYAGRARGLPALLRGLSLSRPCAQRDISVFAGDDTSEQAHLVQSPIWEDNGGRIRLYYTALAHSANVTDHGSRVLPAIKARFGNGDEKGYVRLFPTESLDDGHAIMHHDAVYVAIKAIDRYAKDDLARLGPQEVAAMLRSGTIDVQGAGGDITIDRDGNPLRREIPVLRLTPYGATVFAAWSSPEPAGAARQ